MNIFEGVDTSPLDNMFIVFVKMIIIFMIAPGVIAGIVSKYVFRLSNKPMATIVTIALFLGLLYLLTHFDDIHRWLR